MNTLAAFYQHLGLALSLLVIATFLLAGMIKGVIGLGLPTIAMGLLGLAMAPSQAAALLIIPATLTNVWQLAFGGHLRGLMNRLWPMLLAIFIGTGAGTLWIGMAGGQWVVRGGWGGGVVDIRLERVAPADLARRRSHRALARSAVRCADRHHHLGHRCLRDSGGALSASAGLEQG